MMSVDIWNRTIQLIFSGFTAVVRILLFLSPRHLSFKFSQKNSASWSFCLLFGHLRAKPDPTGLSLVVQCDQLQNLAVFATVGVWPALPSCWQEFINLPGEGKEWPHPPMDSFLHDCKCCHPQITKIPWKDASFVYELSYIFKCNQFHFRKHRFFSFLVGLDKTVS